MFCIQKLCCLSVLVFCLCCNPIESTSKHFVSLAWCTCDGSNFVMNEIPTRLAKHPRIMDNPSLALENTFEEVDRALVEVALEDEQVYR